MTRAVGPPAITPQDHWESVYAAKDEREVSWHQRDPRLSARLIADAAAELDGTRSAIVDAGGGASALAGRLGDAGFTDVTVVDVSGSALATARSRLAHHDTDGDGVDWVHADLLAWRPKRPYRIWHDRAVFHFLTTAEDRAAYLATVRAALSSGGAVIVGTFAADGPRQCSGLPVARYSHEALAAELTAAFGETVTITGRHAERHSTPWDAVQPFIWITARLS